MDWENMITVILCGILATSCFVLAYRQHKQKGFIASNRWIWASQNEREDMDERIKKADYCLGRNVFFLMGFIFLVIAAVTLASLAWSGYLVILIGFLLVYALVHDFKNAKLYQSIMEEKMQ